MGNRSLNTSSARSSAEARSTQTNSIAIGEKIDIITYANNEWHGNTHRSRNIRQVIMHIFS